MVDWTLPREGGCRCGRVRLKVTRAPMVTMACHCTGCQRMSSSAYSLSAAIPADGFAVVEGEPVIGGLHGPDARHYFCGHCMSWMYTRIAGLDGFVNLRPTMLDDTSGIAPFVETYMSEKLAFAETGAPHGFERFPPMDRMPELIEAYRNWSPA